ncbi:hypothetical protein ACIQPS_36335 [Streptomyces sp. NPDC091290]|uniref:hypothetical protein n=1 Tax=Streptomyces sp. NPDC091290 TaxID=3365990 RepID=UPI0038030BA0
MACAPSDSDMCEVFSAPIGHLQRLTEQCLDESGDPQNYVYLLQCLLSFKGVESWDRCLESLQTGECEIDCPYCGVNMFIVIGEDRGDIACPECGTAFGVADPIVERWMQ